MAAVRPVEYRGVASARGGIVKEPAGRRVMAAVQGNVARFLGCRRRQIPEPPRHLTRFADRRILGLPGEKEAGNAGEQPAKR